MSVQMRTERSFDMLNRIMMTGRITTDLNILTEEDYSYCKFSMSQSQILCKRKIVQ